MSKLLINRWLRKTASIVRYDERNGGVFFFPSDFFNVVLRRNFRHLKIENNVFWVCEVFFVILRRDREIKCAGTAL